MASLPRVRFEIDEGLAWVAPIDAIDPLLGPAASSLLLHRLADRGWPEPLLHEEFPFFTDPSSPMYQEGACEQLERLKPGLREDLCSVMAPELSPYSAGMQPLRKASGDSSGQVEVLLPFEAVLSAALDDSGNAI